MAAPILRQPAGWPSVLLARAGKLEARAGLAEAEKLGAWVAWKSAVRQGPEAVVRAVGEAGLRGRGGAGYPTADKWRAVRAQPAPVRYAVANGYEADPGVVVDRTLMAADPHAVLEGLALAAFAVGAEEGFLVVRADATAAIERLTAALEAAQTAGYLGYDVLGSGVTVEIQIRPLEGGFLLGEETVLMRALEGKRGMPDQRPPYPSERGLFGAPTVVNNVATLASVPWLLVNGPAKFRAIGDPDFPGTVLVQLSGAVHRPGVAEVPTGTPLAVVVDKAAGGATGQLKAALVGGPSGGFLPPDGLATPLAPGPLEAAGAILGSGSVLVLDEHACIVELATLMERFMNDESCGKCIPCRIGTRRLTEIGERFMTGRPRPTDPGLLLDLAADVRDGSLCGHGITAPNPLTSGMRYFRQEFDDHIVRGRCAAGVCKPLRVAAGAAR
ncbi:MAG TPA: NADH-ubiquinone oxidoreductase-F iron-sulfur binding region domain-containing protein [Candidatus Limnocylindrales bacterium]